MAWPEPVQRVSAVLRAAAIEARIEEFADGTPTARDTAKAVGCDLSQIVKSLVFVCDGAFVLALVPGDRRADEEAIGAAVSAQLVRVARPEEVVHATGFEPGAVAPFPAGAWIGRPSITRWPIHQAGSAVLTANSRARGKLSSSVKTAVAAMPPIAAVSGPQPIAATMSGRGARLSRTSETAAFETIEAKVADRRWAALALVIVAIVAAIKRGAGHRGAHATRFIVVWTAIVGKGLAAARPCTRAGNAAGSSCTDRTAGALAAGSYATGGAAGAGRRFRRRGVSRGGEHPARAAAARPQR